MNNIIDDFIDNLIQKNNTTNLPEQIDLIISGGAFNGMYAIGIAMYLKKLEKLNRLKVNRISGASVGSVIGFAYLLDKLNLFNDLSNEIIYLFKTRCNLYDFRKKMFSILDMMDEKDYLKLNKKLYITYFDTVNKKQKVIKTYKNNKHVIDTIIKSCYIPFLMNDKISYKGKIDGGYPYIFKNDFFKRNQCSIINHIDKDMIIKKNKKTLYINLLSFKYINKVFCLKNEYNSHLRILTGIIDINKFISSNTNTSLCSYIDDWNFIDYLSYYLTAYMMFLSIIFLDFIRYLSIMIPNNFLKNKYYVLFKSITYNMYKDLFKQIMC